MHTHLVSGVVCRRGSLRELEHLGLGVPSLHAADKLCNSLKVEASINKFLVLRRATSGKLVCKDDRCTLIAGGKAAP